MTAGEELMIEIKNYGEVTQIKLSTESNGKPLYWVSAYFVDGLLIDTGSDKTSDELIDFLRTVNLKKAVNTHYHEDHIGGNRKIIEQFGIDIYAHKDSAPLIAAKPFLYPYQEVVFGYPEPADVKILSGTIKTDNCEFRIIETPGHCDGHVVLIETSGRWCFSGDIFTREKIKFIRPEENIGQQIESMNMLISMTNEKMTLFTATGRVIEKGRDALIECVNYLTDLHSKVKRLSNNGMTADQIVTELFGGENIFSQMTNGQFSSLNLVKSLLEI